MKKGYITEGKIWFSYISSFLLVAQTVFINVIIFLWLLLVDDRTISLVSTVNYFTAMTMLIIILLWASFEANVILMTPDCYLAQYPLLSVLNCYSTAYIGFNLNGLVTVSQFCIHKNSGVCSYYEEKSGINNFRIAALTMHAIFL